MARENSLMSDARDANGGISRRRMLLGAGAGASLGLTAGCLQRVRNLVDRPSAEQLSLEIKAPPADENEPATQISRRLESALTAIGIDVEITLLREDELKRDVLVKDDFEIYVDRMPLEPDPDFLRSRLHSVFVGDAGWQNPFGLVDLDLDEALAAQRTQDGPSRRRLVATVTEQVARLQPFVSVAIPDEISAIRTERFSGWAGGGLASPTDFLVLGAASPAEDGRLNVTTTDPSVTLNLNPLSVTQRDRSTVLGLLYDPLGRRYQGDVRPWLATDWEWDRSGERTTVTISLQDGLTWHDGRDLTAEDVAFTYRFLDDTTMGERDAAVPAPRFRGRTSIVNSVSATDDRVVTIDVGQAVPTVAERALTVPILPAHVWRSKSREAELAGVGVNDLVTEALVWANAEPVGSGPLAFERRISEEALYLRRNDEHFLHGDAEPPWPAVAGGADFEELSLRVAPSTVAAVELVAAGEADATVPTTDPSVTSRIARQDDLTLSVRPAPFLYHVGFNTRLDPLGNPYVRRTIARCLDKAAIVEDVFDGYARPAATPLAGTDWIASGYAWDDGDPTVPFVGGDEQFDADRARDLFRDIGFQYQDGTLLAR